MRAREFVEEGVSDWLAQKGFLGKDRQFTAVAAQMGKEAEKAEQARAENLANIFKQRYTRTFKDALVQAEEGGLVKVGASGSGMPVKDFVEKYFNTMTKNLQIDPTQQAQLNNLYTEFESSYRGGGNLPDTTNKIFSAIAAIKSIQQDSTPITKPPGGNITAASPFKTKRFQYTYDKAADTWSQFPLTKGGAPFPTAPTNTFTKTSDEYGELNKAYAASASKI